MRRLRRVKPLHCSIHHERAGPAGRRFINEETHLGSSGCVLPICGLQLEDVDRLGELLEQVGGDGEVLLAGQLGAGLAAQRVLIVRQVGDDSGDVSLRSDVPLVLREQESGN